MNLRDHQPKSPFSLTSREILWPLCLLVLGFVCITLHQSDYFRAIPGNMGDARFNNDILEHLFRWVTGKDSSLWSPPYFYPYPGTLTFSDNHFGTGLAYILFRLFGLGPEGAFVGWYSLAVPLNFISCYYVLRRSGLSHRGSAVGAFIFTFAFNVAARHGHAQLSYRAAIPLAILAAQRLVETKAPRQLALLVLWVTWQFYCSIYLGYFLTLMLIAYAIMHTVLTPEAGASRPHQAIGASVRDAWIKKDVASAAIIGLCLVALAVMFYPYMRYSHLYQLSRGYAEIQGMLPRPVSYLLADGSLIWGKLSQHITDIPMRWEHQMFFGASACVLAAFGIRACWDRPTKIAMGAFAILSVLTLNIHGYSIYHLIYNLPLANAIRAVSRIGLVTIFPIAFMAGRGFDWLTSSPATTAMRKTTAFALLIFTIVEYTAFLTETVPIKQLHQRVNALLSLVPSQLPNDAIIYVPPRNDGGYPFANELDGMRLVAEINRPTLNGYSGSVPRAFTDPEPNACDVVNNRLANYASFANISYEQYSQLVHRVVVLGNLDSCTPRPALGERTHFSGSIREQTVAGTTLSVLNPRIVDGKLVVTLQIDNHSGDTLHSISDEDRPIRFSWRTVAVHKELGAFDHWDTRKDLTSDVEPGAHASVEVIVTPPREPGEYYIESSLVQENALWFHQYGMPIARSKTTIVVKGDGSMQIQPEGTPHK